MQRIAHDTRSFDGFTIDLTRGCLLRGSEEIKLQPKPFGALTYLVENPGRLIEKAELIQVLWPDTAVTDDSLVQCIGDVRRALGDETQQIIRTVTRRGYIFDRPVVSGPTALTTYTEEKGVQIIIEEQETNGHPMVEASTFPTPLTAGLISAHKATSIERLTTAIKQHRRAAAMGVLSVALVAAGIVYFTRPSEAIDSVAVMPFVNVNGDPNTDYLSEGISDNIISRLSKLPNLRVIALNSVLRYKGKQAEPQEIGRTLNVRAVLVSRLTQHGDDVSISTELIDVRDNRRLWGEQYNRKLSDIATVQTDIAQEISENLRLRLTGEVKQQLAKRYTQDPEAYRLYMMGRYYFHRSGNKEDLEKSIEYYYQAIKKDPSYAPAYAGLGTTYHLLGFMGWMLPKESWQKEEWAALKALQIDDQLPEAHVLTAAIREFNLDWTGAEEEYKRALELDPNSVRAHQTYAWHLEMFGRFDDAMSHTKRAQELDPLSLELMWDMGVWFSFSRQYDRAIEQFQKIIEMDSKFIGAHSMIAETYQKKGMYEEAIAELKSANVSGPPLGYAYAVAGKRDEAQKILNDLKEQSKQRYVSPKAFAMVYMGLGDKDQAFEWFNKTFEENPYRIAWLKVDPRFDSLRSDPRFDALLRRMKLAP
jgi:TolB-like protein/DNA-binding winged helix-turn-helix (wHTH) protein/Tfp pilus assembly protein PilF